MPGPIKSWSISALGEFDKCKQRVFFMRVQKIAEPQRPLPPGKKEHANDRGSRVHNENEDYVAGRSDYLPIEMEKHFGPQLDLLRVLYAAGMVSLEGEWGYDDQWNPAPWATAWHRCKLDAIVLLMRACGDAYAHNKARMQAAEAKTEPSVHGATAVKSVAA